MAQDGSQLVSVLQARAADYEQQATAAITPAGRDVLLKAAQSFRRLADQVEADPPRWLADDYGRLRS
jgi:RecB family endonuclease NucS